MRPEIIVVRDNEGLALLTEYVTGLEYVAFDTETTGLFSSDHVIGFSICGEEAKAYYVILKYWTTEQSLLDTKITHDEVLRFLGVLKTKALVAHNGVFDCMIIASNFKVSLIESLHTDTMILAHLLDENRRVGLKELARSIYRLSADSEQKEMEVSILANGGKIDKKGNYELYKADPDLIAKYGAMDAYWTYRLFCDLVPQLYEKNLDKFFYEDESMPLLRTCTYEMNTVGLVVDGDELQKLKRTLIAECEEAKAFIDSEIKPHVKERYPGTNKKNVFNIGATQQLSWLLFGVLNQEFGTLTAGGKQVAKALDLKLPYTKYAKKAFIETLIQVKGSVYAPGGTRNGKPVKPKTVKDPWGYIACDTKVLEKIAPKLRWVQKLLEYKKKTKLLSTYVEGIESRTRYGVIYPSFLQHGTKTGRYSSRDPNFQNLPRDDKRIKKCIVARPGKVFVGADQSQLEPRMFASISGDARLCSSFAEGQCAYSIVGIEVYDKFECSPFKEGKPDAFGTTYPVLRQDAKTFMLAATYGASGWQLASKMKKTPEEAQADIEKYFERFPAVRKMMLDTHEEVKDNGYVLSLFGRPRRLPEALEIRRLYGDAAHEDLPYEARKLLNAAVNYKMQGGGSSVINRSAIRTKQNILIAGISCSLVLQVHDSLVLECDEKDAEDLAVILQDAMENTIELPGVRLEAVPKIGKTLADV